MSLYNLVNGVNRVSSVLLASLGFTEADIPRYRDCFLSDHKIVIHTRTGGGNREWYEEDNDRISQHPNFLHDEDDDFDCTYANFYYSFPEEYKTELEMLEKSDPSLSVKPSEKWQALLESLKQSK